MCNVTHTDIAAGLKTDFTIVTIKIAFHRNHGGSGFWKLSTSCLSETQDIESIIESVRRNIKMLNQ